MPTEPAYVLGMTAAELLQIPDKHAELVRGALVVREPPGLRHGRIAMEIATALGAHVRAHQLGRVYAESGFKLNVESRYRPRTRCRLHQSEPSSRAGARG